MRRAEEQQIAGLYSCEVDALALGYFAGLFGGRAAKDRLAPRQARELVDAPGEPEQS